MLSGCGMGNRSDTDSIPMLAPVHLGVARKEGELTGAEAIASVFGVNRKTVIRWHRMGAPIKVLGNKYQSEYYMLWAWILEQDNP